MKAIRGMQDLLPEKKARFRLIEDQARRVLAGYGYQEVGLPILESTSLFSRLVGASTDIVEKEMYTFNDRNEESLTLRPEGTAGLVRFVNEHGLAFNQTQRLWYTGPMFRYERPQKGRYRQFDQIGVECIGMEGPDIDAELLLLSARLWSVLGLSSSVTLELNSIGDAASRQAFSAALVDYLTRYKSDLDEDSLRRLTTNPMRILDTKVPTTQALLVDAPVLSDFIDAASRKHFDGLCAILDAAEQPYRINPSIVRGLDYYNRTVFEWVTDELGAQGTICGGGRYDGLVAQLGGKPTPCVGFALGLDRLALMLEGQAVQGPSINIYGVSVGDDARGKMLVLAEQVRTQLGLSIQVHAGAGKLKAQMKKADASGAEIALIVAEDELAQDAVSVRELRGEGGQALVQMSALIEQLQQRFKQ
ncbi:MAG: histidine--tRNA ligase [Gammaproteobacteria bacterium]|nr:histidine--tRNA ligase [Gammaproteobacteria bacterium]